MFLHFHISGQQAGGLRHKEPRQDGPDAGGIQDCSRGLSEATPPESGRLATHRIPEGCQRTASLPRPPIRSVCGTIRRTVSQPIAEHQFRALACHTYDKQVHAPGRLGSIGRGSWLMDFRHAGRGDGPASRRLAPRKNRIDIPGRADRPDPPRRAEKCTPVLHPARRAAAPYRNRPIDFRLAGQNPVPRSPTSPPGRAGRHRVPAS